MPERPKFRQCVAEASTTGERCRKEALTNSRYCRVHRYLEHENRLRIVSRRLGNKTYKVLTLIAMLLTILGFYLTAKTPSQEDVKAIVRDETRSSMQEVFNLHSISDDSLKRSLGVNCISVDSTVCDMIREASEAMAADSFLKAERDYTWLLKFSPSNPDLYFNRGNARQGAGKYSEAIEDWRKVIELRPNDIASYFDKGAAFHQLREYDSAEVAYKKALELSPNNVLVRLNLGHTYMEKGKLDSAVVVFEEALNINPNDADVYDNLGFALYLQGKFDEAIKNYNRAIELKPDRPYAYFHLGQALRNCNRSEEAIRVYRKAIETCSTAVPQIYDSFGLLLMDMKQYQAARPILEKFEAVSPGDGAYNLACLESIENHPEKCQEWLLKSRAKGKLPELEHILGDPDLSNVRSLAWFRSFVESLKVQESKSK